MSMLPIGVFIAVKIKTQPASDWFVRTDKQFYSDIFACIIVVRAKAQLCVAKSTVLMIKN